MIKILYFWAPWCQPCKQFKPTLESIQKDFPKIPFHKINIDEHLDMTKKYDVMSIPTLIIQEDEKEIGRFIGVTKKEILEQALL